MIRRLEEFCTELLQAANLPDEKPVKWIERQREGTIHQRVFERLLDACATIRLRKAQSYGESRYEVESPEFDLAMAYSDVHRKVIRINEQTTLLKQQIFGSRQQPVLEDISETAADLTNYAAQLLQLVFYLQLLQEQQPTTEETE